MEDSTIAVEPSTFEMLVQHRELGEAACEHPERAARLLPRLAAISALGLVAYALVQGAVLSVGPSGAQPLGLEQASFPVRALALFLAYAAGIFGAQVAALPSAYFYALQAGIRTHAWRIAAEAMRAQATAAVVLLGLLPVYLAAGLGVGLGHADSGTTMLVHGMIGYTLPFVGGLAGTVGLARAFVRIARGASSEGSRSPWPVMAVLAWSALFTSLAPLAVARVLHTLS